MRHERLWRSAHHVLLIQPCELVRIECRSRLVDVLDVEQLLHFAHREHFLVAMRPAETDEIVEQRLGQVALVSILQHAHCTVTLRELCSVGAENHGHMRIHRRYRSQRFEHVDLTGRVVQMIVAANHVRDLHVHVIDDDTEVVRGRTVRARDDQIIELGVLKDHVAMNRILDHD